MLTFLEMGAKGRFGNQLFQLAALMGIAAWKGTSFRIPIENTHRDLARHANRKTGNLEKSSLELHLAFALPRGWFAPRAEILKVISSVYREHRFGYDPEVVNVPDGSDISGYFQSERYFAHIAADVRSALAFHPPLRADAQRNLTRIASGLPKVAIHVRRGDYLRLQNKFAVLPLAYYRQAMSMHSANGPCQFLVFSDDPEWCGEAFPGCRIVHSGSAHLDLCLMSMCDHFIIANSSFSWWGAWLSTAPNKNVVCPIQWWGPELTHNGVEDLLPAGWLPI